MRRTDAAAFTAFMQSEAMKYARDITPHEIATWFENFTSVTVDDFKNAWDMHKASDKGHYFPRIVDLQRLLKTIRAGATTDKHCAVTHSKTSARCQYWGTISVERRKAICRCHMRLLASDHTIEESDVIVENSRTRNVDEVYKELGQKRSAPMGAAPAIPRLSNEGIGASIDEAISGAISFDEANHDDLMARIAAHQAQKSSPA